MGIPDLEKAGKAVQLKRAVEYMAEMGERLGGVDKELEDLRREKQDLEVCSYFSPVPGLVPFPLDRVILFSGTYSRLNLYCGQRL